MLKFLQRLALDFPYICLKFFLGLSYRQMYKKFEKVVLVGLLAHVMPSIFLVEFLGVKDKFAIHSFFRTDVLRKLFDIRFSYKHCNFSRVCLLFEMASKSCNLRKQPTFRDATRIAAIILVI